MATKNNPGAYDCYANAEPDEPMFVLLGRDKSAAHAVEQWIFSRITTGKNWPTDPQILEAEQCVRNMRAYFEARKAAGK